MQRQLVSYANSSSSSGRGDAGAQRMDNQLVSYASSSSSSSGSGDSGAQRKKLKLTLPQEESEVLSVVHYEANGLTAESIGDPTAILLDWGCKPQQVAAAIAMWGKTAPVEELFDFIQAYECSRLIEIAVLKSPARQEEAKVRLECSFPMHDTNSMADLTEKRKPVLEVPDYIHAACYSNEASCSRSHNVGGLDQGEDENVNTLQQLERIGFAPDLVQRASEVCNSIDFDVLLEHLVETRKDNLYSQNQTQPEVGSFPECKEANRSATLERLEKMGYSPTLVQRASEECNSIDFDVLLEYLIGGEELQNEVDSSDNDDGEIKPVTQLQNMGFPLSSIWKATETSGCQDFDRLLAVLSGPEYTKNREIIDGRGEGRQPSAHVFDVQEKDTSTSLLKQRSGSDYIGSSIRWSAGELKWTGDMDKQWYSYVGGKKNSGFLLNPDSEDSETDTSAATWEEVSAKSNRGKKKIEFNEIRKVNSMRPRQGKMMGFGIPDVFIGRPNAVPTHMQGPPYFYYEMVASVPNNEWDTIKRHFNGVHPEFTDSKYFSACRRPRGYVHNLPVENRMPLLCATPMTIFEALPRTQQYWPSWDTREKLNFINTCKASDTLCGLIRSIFQMYKGVEIPFCKQQEIVQLCEKWNLIWVGPGLTAPLEPFEMELLLGFDEDHTRGCSSMMERYEAVGSSFQVNTVAFHLSPLKALYPNGMTVLSLFSGIGGAEVALNKLGIPLKLVIAVEINEKLRGVLSSWWKKSRQSGELKLRVDVRDLTDEALTELINEVGNIDLIIGGSPCNFLSGNNRVNHAGFCSVDLSLFFEFTRILTFVRQKCVGV